MKILIVEDDARDASRLIEKLIDLGHDRDLIKWISTDNEAEQLLEHEEEFDFGIFDIDLRGETVKGIYIGLKFIQKNRLPVIFATQYSNKDQYMQILKDEGISQNFFVDKRQLENKTYLGEMIEEVLGNFDFPKPQKFEYYLHSSRKIGVLASNKGNRDYEFLNKDEIMFIKGDGNITEIHTDAKIYRTSRNIGSVAKRIGNVFYNIVRLDRSHYINLEQMDRLEGSTLYFTNDEHINLSSAGKQYLKKHGLLITAK